MSRHANHAKFAYSISYVAPIARTRSHKKLGWVLFDWFVFIHFDSTAHRHHLSDDRGLEVNEQRSTTSIDLEHPEVFEFRRFNMQLYQYIH